MPCMSGNDCIICLCKPLSCCPFLTQLHLISSSTALVLVTVNCCWVTCQYYLKSHLTHHPWRPLFLYLVTNPWPMPLPCARTWDCHSDIGICQTPTSPFWSIIVVTWPSPASRSHINFTPCPSLHHDLFGLPSTTSWSSNKPLSSPFAATSLLHQMTITIVNLVSASMLLCSYCPKSLYTKFQMIYYSCCFIVFV